MDKKKEVDINIKIDLVNLSTGVNIQGEPTKDKVATSLSVSQLAYLTRLLHEAKLISCQNKSDLLARLARSLVTKNSTEISVKSLKAKFYTVDPATKESVKGLLLELLNSIR